MIPLFFCPLRYVTWENSSFIWDWWSFSPVTLSKGLRAALPSDPAAKSLQSCLTLCDPIDGSPPGFPRPWDSPGKNTGVGCHFLLQCMKVKVKSLSSVWLLATPWSAAYQAPPSLGFSRQEYWSGVPLPSPSGFLLQGIWGHPLLSFVGHQVVCALSICPLNYDGNTEQHLPG